MTTDIKQYSYDPLANVLEALNRFIERIEKSHQTFRDNLRLCSQLRDNRKSYEQHMKGVLLHFKTLPEKSKVDVELKTLHLINRLNAVAPVAIEELQEADVFFFSWFLSREIRLTVDAFKKGQIEMEKSLYPDNSKAITENPDLCKKLEDAWGDLANDDY